MKHEKYSLELADVLPFPVHHSHITKTLKTYLHFLYLQGVSKAETYSKGQPQS